MTVHYAERLQSPAPLPIDAGKPVLGRMGSLEARLATTRTEIREAQRLRYRSFVEERGLGSRQGNRLDRDHFDAFCDHLIIADMDNGGRIVGTYRLLRQEMAVLTGGFYSASWFDVAKLAGQNPGKRILELGRSCVEPAYRAKRTIDLLWQAIWAYCRMHDVDVLTGCASFAGDNPFAHSRALTLLAKTCHAQGNWHVRALAGRWHSMMLEDPHTLDEKAAFLELPPLLKGYLRVGAKIGDGCVIDPNLQTTVVLVVMPVENISGRYRRHFDTDPHK